MTGNTPRRSGWEQLFRLVFETTSNPVVLLDNERRILEANGAALSLWGGTKEELIGSSITESIKEEERPRALREWKTFRLRGEYSGARALVKADGSEVQVGFAARAATVAGRRLAIYVVTTDPDLGGSGPTASAELPLTAREREVATLIVLGRGTRDIASELHISIATVRTHVRNAMAKVGVHSRAQLVAAVLCTEGLIHEETLERR